MPGDVISIVFPGQGSQKPGMLASYFKNISSFRETFSEASDHLGIDLLDLVNNGTDEDLSKTTVTQPLMLTAGISIWRSLPLSLKSEVKYLAGHSLGEYSALVASEAFNFQDGLKLVAQRAKLMQEAVPIGEGGIAAILGLPISKINLVCQELSEKPETLVSAANLNSEMQTVISGTKKGVELAIHSLKKMGAKRAILLPMSVPAHCILMKEASVQFSSVLDDVEILSPKIPVIQNVLAKESNSPEEIKENLVSQMHSPVNWVDSILYFKKSNIDLIIECGPGKVLTSLTRQIYKDSKYLDLDNYINFKELNNQYGK